MITSYNPITTYFQFLLSKTKLLLHFIFFFIFLTGQILAQNGKVVGKVTDKDTGDPLFGANVFISGTSIGAATDIDGNYSLPIVPVGNQVLDVKYIGFQEQKINIEVVAGRTLEINFELESEVLEGEEVVISAQALGQKQAINQQISAKSIKNVVSAAKIEEIPDATAAESVGRLPGVSINRSGGEANKVTVRGLAPRFNNVQLDGVNMKSTDLNNRSTDISMISPSMLSGIEITKANTADMEANSLGGTINLTIKEAPEGLHYDLSMEGGYDSHREELNNYKIVGSVSNRFLDNNLGVYVNGYVEQRNRGTNLLNPNFQEDFRIPEVDRPNQARFAQINFEDRKEVRQRFGGTLVLDYKLPFGALKLSNFASQMDRDLLTQNQGFSYDGTGYSWGITKSGENLQIQMVNKLAGTFDVLAGKLDVSFSHSLARRDQPIQRSLGGWGGFELTQPVPEEEYLSLVNFTKVPIVDGRVFGDLGNASQDSHDSHDREYTAKIDHEIPFNIGDFASGSFKLGGLYKYNSREYDFNSKNIPIARNAYSRVWEHLIDEMPDVFTTRNNRGEINPYDGWDDHFDNDLFLDGKYNIWPFFSLDHFDTVHELSYNYYNKNGYQWDTNTNSFSNDQDGLETTTSFYAMTELSLLNNKLTLIPGVRYEKVDNEYTGYRLQIPLSNLLRTWELGTNYWDSTATSTHENWFPSIHVRVFPTDWMDIRFAYTKTASRPNYSDLVPWSVQNPNSTPNPTINTGNANLKPQLSENLDLYLSFYNNHIGLASIGFFQKTIDDLIWSSSFFMPTDSVAASFGFPDYKGYSFTTVRNNKFEATLKGLEVEWQTNLWYLPFPFDGLVLSFNYTYIESETRYPYQVVFQPPGFPPKPAQVSDTSYTGSIVGQPKNVFNLSLGYDYKGFSAYVTYLKQDGSLTSINRKEYLNGYAFDYDRWDIKLKQKLPIEGLEVFLNLNNITDTGDRSYFQREQYIDSEEFYGFSGNFGVRFRM